MNPNATKVSHFALARIQRRLKPRISRLHDSKATESGISHLTTPKATKVSHFAPARIQKRKVSHYCICMTPNATKVSHFALARIQRRLKSRISRLHGSKGNNALLHLHESKSARVSHFAPARIQKRPKSRISRVRRYKSDESLACRACRTKTPD